MDAKREQNLPIVSIVLATYNGEKYLSQQLDSLINQTYQNIDIIAIDDGSSDNTIKILQEVATRVANLKVFINEKNLGFVENFDKGCALATGEYLALCDQDDYWHPAKVEKLVEAIGTNALAYCDSFVCDQQLEKTGKRISDIVNCRSFDNCLQQSIFCRIYGHTTLFHKKLYNAATPFLKAIPHDWWLSFLATFNGGIIFLPEPLVYYRQHSTNLFGVVGTKRKNKNKQDLNNKKQLELSKIRTRIHAFYNACPSHLTTQKKVLLQLKNSYASFSLANNCRRVFLFLKHRNTFLAVKKHSALHRFFFCFKMFVKIK